MCALPTFQIVLYGRSLGSGPTCFLAQKLTEQGTPCAGVILQSPLLSAYRVAFNFRFTVRPLQHRLIALSPIALPPPPSILLTCDMRRASPQMPGDVFPNIDRIGRIESPIFIIHGTNDEVVPFWHGQELFLACQKRYVGWGRWCSS